MRFLLTEWFCVDIQLLVTNLHEARCAGRCEHSLKLLHQISFFYLQYYALPFAKSILIYSAEYSVLEFPKIHIFLLVQNIQIAGKTPHKKAFFLLFQVVRPTWATTGWCKTTTRSAVGSVNRRQGCPSRGGIWRKSDVSEKNAGGQTSEPTNRNHIVGRTGTDECAIQHKVQCCPNPVR